MSCQLESFRRANEVCLQLSVLAYILGNLWRRLVLPQRIDSWSLTSVQQRLVKTGGRLIRHARYYGRCWRRVTCSDACLARCSGESGRWQSRRANGQRVQRRRWRRKGYKNGEVF